jgi:hypothetical protein
MWFITHPKLLNVDCKFLRLAIPYLKGPTFWSVGWPVNNNKFPSYASDPPTSLPSQIEESWREEWRLQSSGATQAWRRQSDGSLIPVEAGARAIVAQLVAEALQLPSPPPTNPTSLYRTVKIHTHTQVCSKKCPHPMNPTSWGCIQQLWYLPQKFRAQLFKCTYHCF